MQYGDISHHARLAEHCTKVIEADSGPITVQVTGVSITVQPTDPAFPQLAKAVVSFAKSAKRQAEAELRKLGVGVPVEANAEDFNPDPDGVTG
jgi:hypothetical protein